RNRDSLVKAVELARRVQGHHPADFSINFELAVQLGTLGPLEEAVAFFRVASALRPRSPLMRLALGHALRMIAERDDAPTADGRLEKERAQKKREQWDEVVAVYREAASLPPDSGMAHLALGYSLARRGDWVVPFADGPSSLAVRSQAMAKRINRALA